MSPAKALAAAAGIAALVVRLAAAQDTSGAAPAAQSRENLLQNAGKSSTRGVGSGWVVSPGSRSILSSISRESRQGSFSQRIDILATHPDRPNACVTLLQPQSAVRLEGRTQYELAAWVKGGCWDYVDRAYDDAGYPAQRRTTVFRSGPDGPYANTALIRPGDWISFRNLTYGEIGHDALFVDWIDIEKHSCLVINYAGEGREIPGCYREFGIFKCFIVVRPAE